MTRRLTLALDAARSIGSVALLDGERVVGERSTPMRNADRETLLPAVAELLAEHGVAPRALNRVVCGEGPGSFTSLRIAASIAKGVARGSGAKLYAVSSLLLTVAGLVDGKSGVAAGGRFLSVLDAMRGESFVACYEVGNDGIAELAAPAIAHADELSSIADRWHARLIGPGLELDASPRAAGVARLGPWLERAGAVDLATWEPVYGRLAEAQVRWEAVHGRPLDAR